MRPEPLKFFHWLRKSFRRGIRVRMLVRAKGPAYGRGAKGLVVLHRPYDEGSGSKLCRVKSLNAYKSRIT